jgi:cell division protein FtsN
VTTSSPESEPHVEHTILANGIRQGPTGRLVLSQLHIGLAVGFALVACLTAFGGGMIVGMWYKASEHSAPVSTSVTSTPAEQSAQSQETASQPQEAPAPVTFYNTLTNSNVAYAPLTPPVATGGPPGSAKGTAAPAPAAGTTSGARAASSGTAGSTKAATASKATSSAAGTTRTAALHEPQKHTKATPAAKAVPGETTASPGGTKTAAQKPAAPVRQAGKETATQRPAGATATAPGAEDFHVQVGSFGSSEPAERLRTHLSQKGYLARVQPAAVPGQGLRYRVRVGTYTERTAADQTAQHLTAQEQVPAIVAGKD